MSSKTKMSIPPAGDAASGANQVPVILESNVPLSSSLIWRRQREFYMQRGMGAWTADRVPQFITNNPFIAEIYANLVFHFLCDCLELDGQGPGGISPQNPLRILELGAGPGKFAYLFLRHLAPLLRAKALSLETVRYCMTDCSERVLESWRANPYLSEFVACGVLEFDLFETGQDVTKRFGAGQESPARPLVVIANYVFDSLPQDAFVIQGGQDRQDRKIFESLVTATIPYPTSQSAKDNVTPAQGALQELQLSYQNVALPPERYADATWNEILEQYQTRLSSATVLFPSVTLTTLGELGTVSDGRILVLAADKGYAHEDALALSQGPPALEWHAGDCFSLMVNLDAIGKFFRATGGEALLPDKHFSSLNICGFLRGQPGEQFPRLINAYQQAQAAFGPDDLFTLLAWLNAHMEEMSVGQILAALRLTHWDPVALMRLFPVLGRQLRTVVAERADLRVAVTRTWANHYPVTQDENILAFQCGVVLLELRFFAEAMAMFKTSQKVLSPSAATSYNLGLCAQGLGQSDEALAFMVEACNLDPNFEQARAARHKLESKGKG
ncbi:MAG TPA: SAM-dependent methyltransferase [Candidatus Angelobacter sp.]